MKKYIRASYYSTPEGSTYLFDLYEDDPGVYNFSCNTILLPDGTEGLLHNEVVVTFKLVNGKPCILSGYHIGTEDFDFDEGDSWEDYVESYHPGITEQVMDKLQRGRVWGDRSRWAACFQLDRYIKKDVWVLIEYKNGLWSDPIWIKILDRVSGFQDGEKVYSYIVSRINVAYSDLYYVNDRNEHSTLAVDRIKVYEPLTTHTTAELEQLIADNK